MPSLQHASRDQGRPDAPPQPAGRRHRGAAGGAGRAQPDRRREAARPRPPRARGADRQRARLPRLHPLEVDGSVRRRNPDAAWSTSTAAPTCARPTRRHWRFVVALADALGARAVLPAYPLAPEFTVDDSFEEMVQLVEEVAAESPDGYVLAGDSAGGGYALALAQALRDRGATPARPTGAARPLGRPHRLRAGHARGRRARPVAVLRPPRRSTRRSGRARRPRPRSPTRG